MDQAIDFEATTQITDPNSNPIEDFSLYTIEGKMQKSYSSTTSYSFTCEFLDSPFSSWISISMSSSANAIIKPGNYYYDICLVDQTGKRIKLIEGIVFVSATVTK